MRISTEPIYAQIHRTLKSEVVDHYGPGDQLPPEGKLAERFNVNRHTLRRAVDELVSEGIVERRRGVGLFVLERTFDYALHAHTRLTANLAEAGLAGRRRFIRKFIAPAEERIAAQLKLTPGERVICLHYLITANEKTFSLATHFFSEERFARLYTDYDAEGSLHQFIAEHYALTLKRTRSTISAGHPSPEEASRLRVPRNLPLLYVRSLNLDEATQAPIEFVESCFRSDRIELSVRF